MVIRTISECFTKIGGIFGMSKKIRSSSKSFCNEMKSDLKFVWIDMEMTGLDIEKDKILEIACILTDSYMNKCVEGPNFVIHQPDEILDSMNEWCLDHHTKSGLVEESKRSSISESDAEGLLYDFISKHISPKNGFIAGNTVYMDRMFLAKHLPRVNEYLHYRIVDVSTVKELCRSWFPQELGNAPIKKISHRAYDDIIESIEELRFYRDTIFKKNNFEI